MSVSPEQFPRAMLSQLHDSTADRVSLASQPRIKFNFQVESLSCGSRPGSFLCQFFNYGHETFIFSSAPHLPSHFTFLVPYLSFRFHRDTPLSLRHLRPSPPPPTTPLINISMGGLFWRRKSQAPPKQKPELAPQPQSQSQSPFGAFASWQAAQSPAATQYSDGKRHHLFHWR